MGSGKNVVVVVLDTTRYDDIANARTPTLDKIEKEGRKYTNFFANAPWTLPSHATLLSGQYPRTHGAHAAHKQLDTEYRTLAEAFRDTGYETLGVSNNVWFTEEFGLARGFETFYKSWQFTQSEYDFRQVIRDNSGPAVVQELVKHTLRGNTGANIINALYELYAMFSEKRPDKGAKQTNKYLRNWVVSRDSSRPFFLFVNYFEPHLEYNPPKTLAKKYLPGGVSFKQAMEIKQDPWGYVCNEFDLSSKEFEILRALHYAEVEYTDSKIGELVQVLKRNGYWEETTIVVTADHGENIGDHGLMDHQYSLHDSLIHVPLLVAGEGFQGEDDRLLEHIDIVPTLLDAAKIDDSLRVTTAGTSFYPPTADGPEKSVVISEYAAPQPSISSLKERYEVPDSVCDEFDRGLLAIRTVEHKLISGTDGYEQLYTVSENPADECASPSVTEAASLRRRLTEWDEQTNSVKNREGVEIREETQSRLEDLGYL